MVHSRLLEPTQLRLMEANDITDTISRRQLAVLIERDNPTAWIAKALLDEIEDDGVTMQDSSQSAIEAD